MDSLWTQTAQLPQFPPLHADLHTDVLIVGGGLAGLLCAWQLRRSGVDCALIEADRICSGISKNTTAKITSQHGLIYHKLLRKLGPELARLYLEANQAALEQYRALCRDIDCAFEERSAYVYSVDRRRNIDRELEALHRLGFDARFAADLPLPFPTAGAVCFPRQAQFHPLKFAAAIAAGLPIYEHTKALEFLPGKVRTTGGTISAENMIITTHFPLLNKHGSYYAKLYQHRSYVLALAEAPDLGGMYIEDQEGGLSFRNAGRFLLLGGAGHRTGNQGGGWLELELFARRFYPGTPEAARWATQDCMTLDGIPYIGPYSRHTPGLYVATGFNKWGMTSSMVAADLLTHLVLGEESPYAALFSPSRTILHPQLAVNAWESVLGLLTPTVPRCPHMGCALRYNSAEHSWDCPCHGSRFQENGALIDNPATDDKR